MPCTVVKVQSGPRCGRRSKVETANQHQAPLREALPGLVWAVRGTDDGAACEIETGFALGPPESGWLWLHFSLTDSRTLTFVTSLTELPDEARAILTDSDEFQQLHSDAQWAYGMIADICRDIGGPIEQFGYLHFAVGDRLVVTGRRCPLNAVAATRRMLGKGLRCNSAAELLAELIEQLVEGIDDFAARLAADVDRIEDGILVGSTRKVGGQLGYYRRTIVQLHRHVSGLRLALLRLEREGRRVPAAPQLVTATQPVSQRIEQLEHEIVALRERARLLQEEAAALLAEETNRHLRVLSILSILFLPPTFIAGLLGMNLKGMLFAESESGFWLGTLVTVASSVVVAWIIKRMGVFRKQDTD